jgi:uncharacterized protein YceK
MKHALGGLTVSLALLLAGCLGTAFNVLEPPGERYPGPRIFGGIRADLQVIQAPNALSPSSPTLGSEKENRPTEEQFRRVVCALDLPLSVIGDTVTLPYTVPLTLWRLSQPDEVQKPSTQPAFLSAPVPSAPPGH